MPAPATAYATRDSAKQSKKCIELAQTHCGGGLQEGSLFPQALQVHTSITNVVDNLALTPMSVVRLSHRDAQVFAENARASGPETKTTFFDVFGTSDCLLNCEHERILDQNFQYNRTRHVSHSNAEKRRVRSARKEYLQEFYETRQEWFDGNKITASSAQGCGSCNVLRQIIQTLFSSNEQGLSDKYEYSVSQDFVLRRRKVGAEELVETVQLFQPPGQPVRFERFYRSNFLIDRATSIARLRQWMEKCVTNHSHCSKHSATQDDDSRPARLLDITPVLRHGESGIKLVETVSGRLYRYTCLSHRWDNAVEDTRTTQANLAMFQDFLSLGTLPGNFRDAITIARGLNIQYLWIDSLCIIQGGDGGTDLSRELAKMGAIYRNAHLTIMAISSRDSSEGCFIKDKWPDICFSVSRYKDEAYLFGARVLDKKGQPASIVDSDDRFPLLTRAWVFQERLLSSRLLKCNYGEFDFECLESSSCECSSSIPPHQRVKHQWPGNARFTHQRSQLLHGTLGCFTDGERWSWQRNILDYWNLLVKMYMRLSLTYPTDALPAIAGCAKLLASHLQFTYVAGMWEENLATDLLWFVMLTRKGEVLKPRPKDVGAPSWSWASVSMNHRIEPTDSAIGRDWLTSNALLHQAIKEVHCEPECATNPFGRLKDAYIRLEAELYPWYLRQFCHVAEREMDSTRRLKRHDLYLDRSNTVQCTTETQALNIGNAEVHFRHDGPVHHEIPEISTTFRHCASGTPYPCALREVFLLHALRKANKRRTMDLFLLLKRTAPINNKPNCYRRIGLVQVTSVESDGWTWDDMIRDKVTPQRQEFWLF